jgi:hypothetical protein
MPKVVKTMAFIVDDVTYTDIKEAEKAIRTAIIQEEIDISHGDAAQVAEQWDDIQNKVKEAMRGL